MIIDTLLLRQTFYTKLDYNELKDRLKRRTGTNFKLGLIDNEEISLYYLKDWYTEHGIDRVPSCQIEIKNKRDTDGRIQIRFYIATYVLIGLALFPVILMVIFYYTNTPVPFYYAFGIYPLLYLISLGVLFQQADEFKIDLMVLETESKK